MDRMMKEARKVVEAQGFATVSTVQERLAISYTRAAHIVDALKAEDFVEAVCDPAGKYPVVLMHPSTFVFHCCDYCRQIDCLCSIMDGSTVGPSSLPPLHDECACYATAVMP